MSAEGKKPRIDRAEVEKVALLSRLELAGAELEAMTEQLASIVGMVSLLEELDTGTVSPRLHGTEGAQARFRADEPRASLSPAEALANAPERGKDGFRVPAVLD